MTPKATLAFYVDDFKKWRQENYSQQQILINDTDDPSYPKWDDLEHFFSHLLDTRQFSQLDKEDKRNLLYLISRGWDNAAFLYELSENRPISTRGDLSDEDFIELAKVNTSLTGTEYDDGKASIAMCFKKFEYLTLEIETILLKLYSEENEYTKRQALFALAKLGYKDILSLVEKSWLIDNEWHKIGCLIVLDKYIKDKTQLTNYLINAKEYNGEYLAKHIQQLMTKNNC